VGPGARRRWAFLVLGGALAMPYWILVDTVTRTFARPVGPAEEIGVAFSDLAVALPLIVLTAVFPVVRTLEASAARALLGVPLEASAGSRARTALWCVLHLGLGALVAGSTLALPPAVAVLLLRPVLDGGLGWAGRIPAWLCPPFGIVVAVAVIAGVGGAGRLLARSAPRLLGPSAAEQLGAAERRYARLAERNRLARELHDSVGHALSVVTLQAGAAGRVLEADPAFARRALDAIEESARGALAELDHVLGLLREDAGSTTPPPDLRDLDRLVEAARVAGAPVAVAVDVRALPTVVSREAYRIVQEGLTNALKHAPEAPVEVAVTQDHGCLAVVVANPVSGRVPATGGRGLRGIRERAELLGGTAESGVHDGRWQLTARLPVPREAESS
jgi:signal transduction histidine kinase